MASNTNKDYTQMHIKASDHPKSVCTTYSYFEYRDEHTRCNYRT